MPLKYKRYEIQVVLLEEITATDKLKEKMVAYLMKKIVFF